LSVAALGTPGGIHAGPVHGLAADELGVRAGGLVGGVPTTGLQPPSGVLELREQPVELVQSDDVGHALNLLRAEVGEEFPRDYDRHLTVAQVTQLGDLSRVGQRRPVHDHLTGVEVFVDGRAPVHPAARTVEPQSTSHGYSFAVPVELPASTTGTLSDRRSE
jgi:hypothetical protein